ncbi:hypothetical protein SEA_VIBAKI_59 [Arthrobacter phage Vibaki]|uniref:Uncharacterized protein n=1 Tax=Arthrobacter phage Vibaki TaxID=2593333 RepID=A0A514TZ16_9CAUD|nr:hypothetical protein HYP95_gp59 [Arthrobacter phage Vibaki]QDK01939.1 hypothetical protein SEA_VIBAKI_59 [Arthrobacter phage Vibaki]
MITNGPAVTAPATAPCICGWNTPDHNGDMLHPDKCPAVLAAAKAMIDAGIIVRKMERRAAHYVDVADVALIVLRAVEQAQAAALAELAAAFERPRLVSVPTSSSPISLDRHEAYYRPPYTGHAA